MKPPARPASLYAGAASVTPEEIATRQADIECQLETQYVVITASWLVEDMRSWMDEKAQTISRYLTLKDDSLRYLGTIRQSLGLE